MTDIVDRLRYRNIYDYADADALCDEAADEIERLRAALSESGCDHCRHWFDRAALEGK